MVEGLNKIPGGNLEGITVRRGWGHGTCHLLLPWLSYVRHERAWFLSVGGFSCVRSPLLLLWLLLLLLLMMMMVPACVCVRTRYRRCKWEQRRAHTPRGEDIGHACVMPNQGGTVVSSANPPGGEHICFLLKRPPRGVLKGRAGNSMIAKKALTPRSIVPMLDTTPRESTHHVAAGLVQTDAGTG